MARTPYEVKAMMAGAAGEQQVILPVMQKETGKLPNFSEYMETEFDGDYTAARSEYMRKYRVDPSSSSARQIR